MLYYKDLFLKFHKHDLISQNENEVHGNTLDASKIKAIKESLVLFMEGEKPFLNPDFKLNDLALALETNRQYLSFVINHEMHKNFNDFVNEYRVNCFVKDFKKNGNMSIEGMLVRYGFNSKSSFYAAFKKQYAQTPKQYFS